MTPEAVEEAAPSQGVESEESGAAPQRAAQETAPRSTAQAPSTGLPFTGFDLALIGLGGFALLSLGLVMRRLAGSLPRPSA